MEALRIHLKQSSANYKREEIIENKMTYPLPPFSTVIGALHNICDFKEYVPMDISIQGDYHALSKEAYIDHCFLNTTQDDRGILVKMYSQGSLSKGYQRVAYQQKSRDCSFRNGTNIMEENETLLKEYRDLEDLKDKISEYKKGCLDKIKQRKKTLATKKKHMDKTNLRYKKVVSREKEIKEFEKNLNQNLKIFQEENYNKPRKYFRTLITSLKYYEILSDVELIIHVKSDRSTLDLILENIYRLRSLGRSEDFVELIQASIVKLEDKVDGDYKSKYHAYLDADLIDNDHEDIVINEKINGISAQGTKYYLNKNYTFANEEKSKRIFEKKKVYYTSKYEVDTESTGVYIDKSEVEPLIVNFL